MIDEDLLAAQVRAALDEVEVPSGGAQRVLAAREVFTTRAPEADVVADRDPGREPGRNKPSGLRETTMGPVPAWARWVLGSAAALTAVILVSVVVIAGHGGQVATKTSGSAPSAPSYGFAKGNLSGGLVQNHTALGAPAAGPTPPPSSSSLPGSPSPDKVVQTGSLTLTGPDGRVDATGAALGGRATGSGGRVERSQTVDGAGGPYADVAVKVPTGSFANLLVGVRSLGAATAVNTSAMDVTASYVDVAARLHALEATRQQFLEILAKAQSIGDILAVQAQITPLQSQIEQLQGQQQVLDDQSSFATLAIHVAGPTASPPAPHHARGGLSGAWAHARHAFASGIESIVAALGGIAVFLVCAAFVTALARLTWVVVRRRLV